MVYKKIVLNHIDATPDKISIKIGAFQKGGSIDYEKVYNIVIRDLKDGNFKNITLDRTGD